MAEELAHQLSQFPQLCMRTDRLSAYKQWDLDFDAAMQNEFQHGVKAIWAEGVSGAGRFAAGAGRHGAF